MKDLKLLPKITVLVLLALGIVVSIMFYIGGSEGSLEVAGDFLDIPKFTGLFLAWNYILVFLVCAITLFFVVKGFVDTYKVDQKKALRSLAVVVLFIVVALVCWLLGSAEEVKILGYEGTDNVGDMAKLSDAMMYLTYILVVATVATVIWGAIHTRKK